MPGTQTCPKCGAKLAGATLAGLCPKCVAAVAFGPEPEAAQVLPAVGPAPPGAKPRGFGDYELLEEIARGGMGVVFKARQMSLNRMVAVKMILTGQLASAAEVQRFRAEAEAAAGLQHPNIVVIHEVGEDEGQPFFSMDYVEGKSLAQVVQEKPMESKRAASYLRVIAGAIHYAHEQGTLHRDLKPSNVLIDRFDQPRITDFGLAKRVKHDSDLTATGQVLGTPSFMPPEQASAKHGGLGPHSDVYSLGAILYFLLTARAPFSGESREETLSRVLRAEPVAPRLLNPSVPRDLETICLKCLEKDYTRRYPSAKALAEDLDRFLRNEPLMARPIGRPEKVLRWCRRHPALASLAVSLAVTLGAVGSALVLMRERLPTIFAMDAATLKPMKVGTGSGVSIDLSNNNYWAATYSNAKRWSGSVIVRAGATDAIVTNIVLGYCPGAVAVDSIHRVVWVQAQCGFGSDPIWAVNADTYAKIRGPIPCGGLNGEPAIVNPATGRFYHTVNDFGQRVDPVTFAPTRTTFGIVMGVNALANLLYALGPGGVLQIIDGGPDPEKILTNVTLPFRIKGGYLGVDPTLDRIYVPNASSNSIAVLDGRTGQFLKTVMLGAGIANLRGLGVDASRRVSLGVDAIGDVLYASAYTDRGPCYFYAIHGASQHAISIGAISGGPVVNPALNKIYLWTGGVAAE